MAGKTQTEDFMDVCAAWPFPADLDGWKCAHDAIRKDMNDFVDALSAVIVRIGQGLTIQGWEITNLQSWWLDFETHVHQHHDHEERILFPWMNTRVKLPPKMSVDHKTLIEQLDSCKTLIQSLTSSGAVEQQLNRLKEEFQLLQAHMCEHLLEEEEQGLPMLRKNFTHKELKPQENRIIRELKPHDMAWFLRPMGTEEKKRQWMTQTAGLPGFVQSLVMLPACRKYERTITSLLEEVKAGQQAPKKSGFLCFSA